LIAREGVTGIFLTRSVFDLIMDEDADAFTGLKWLLTGGEAASSATMRRFLERHPGTVLRNVYGPVECTALATERRVTAADCEDPGGVPLGRALNGTSVHVLDGRRACAPGEVGEICLSGSGLVHGYLGDPDATAAAFEELELDGAVRRIYRTGDRGRLSAQGVLHFAGRADRQFKVRGHRIEPAEIEQAARQVDGVREAVALPIPAAGGGHVGTVLFHTRTGPSREDVKAVLARRLPSHLVPDRVVELESMPQLSNAKTDLRALAERVPTLSGSGTAAGSGGAGAGADAGTERAVAEVFAAVLGLEQVPVDVPFIELGGDSLGVARLCARLDERLGVAVPPSRVFAAQTVSRLAAWLDTLPADTPETGAADVRRVPLPTHQALYLWEGVHPDADVAYTCPMAWEIDGDLDIDALTAALLDVQERHEALRSRYLREEGPVAEVLSEAP
ncbi:AMP-binding protein, partial [Streptomyces sp. SID11233]|nr:AMP-binding protein [Streptomyces sp. SID11233]